MTPMGYLVRRFFLLGAFLLGGPIVSGADLPKGRVLQKVACAADASQTYALYVPSNFEAGRTWPVLFCFDPGAWGWSPVERFHAAAEQLGYIVVGSNNSRNGPWEANATAISAVFKDVATYFPINPKRVYVAGLSGGARVACHVAMAGLAQGVVACSAAFMAGETPPKVPFPFFGTAGVTDFNYLELRRTDRELEDRRVAHRVIIHSGGHEWLSTGLALEALAWLDLQAMRTGTKAKEAAWIQAQFEARSAAVPPSPAIAHFFELRSLAADFKGLVDTAALDRQVATLAASREIRDGLKAERTWDRREEGLRDDLLGSMQEGFVSDVRKAAAELRAKAEKADDVRQRQMATRVLQSAYSNCSENARALLRVKDYGAAATQFEMMTVLRPERVQAFFDLARTRALLGDKKRAIEALRQAAAAGFKDTARVEQEPAFAALKQDPGFQAVVSAMK